MPDRRTVRHSHKNEVAQVVLASPVLDELSPANLKFVVANGYRTRYFEAGSGEPLVLFHGGHFSSLYSLDAWSLALPALAERFHVFAVDKLGQGYTDNPKTPEHYTFDELLDHSIAVMDALGIKNAHLSGHSRGALLIAAIALKRPDLVKSLVIVSTNTLAPDDPRYPGGAFYAEVDKRTPPGPPTLASVRMEPDAQAWSTAQVTDDFVARLLEIARQPKHDEAVAAMKAGAVDTWNASMAVSKTSVLAEIDANGLPCPAIIIWGADDKSAFVPLAHILFDRIRAKTPKASLHIVNHSGHYVFREQTEEFVKLVELWCLDLA